MYMRWSDNIQGRVVISISNLYFMYNCSQKIVVNSNFFKIF
jgi:hypothetical protein